MVTAALGVAGTLSVSFPYGDRMYRSKNRQQLEFPDFYLPFRGHLDPENRWIALARLVPWELAEEIYHAELCQDVGAPIVPSRTAWGALLVKERLGLSGSRNGRSDPGEPLPAVLPGLHRVHAGSSVGRLADGRLP